MSFFTGNKIANRMLMILYITLTVGILCSIANDEGPIQNNPDR